jgi:hypothetical protein
MYIRIVTFRLHEMTDDQYERHAVRIASAFTAWSGLRAKFWLADRPQRLFGGIYLFDSRAHADKSRSTPLFTGMVDNPAFADLSIQEFDLLTAPTSITTPGWPAAA